MTGDTLAEDADAVHESVIDVLVTLTMRGAPGGGGRVETSGERCILPFADGTTVTKADHDVSPLPENAVHVYCPESAAFKSVEKPRVVLNARAKVI